MYILTLLLTSMLDGGGWSVPPRRFILKKDIRYPLYGGLGGSLGRSGRVRKLSLIPALSEFINHFFNLEFMVLILEVRVGDPTRKNIFFWPLSYV
jgi:hypothetical protein